jgi:hypothetical protein
MTEREELILSAVLDQLADTEGPMAEAMIHALVQNKLGVVISSAELAAVLQLADQRGYAIGLPGVKGRVRWSLSDKGRHYRANQ